MSSISIKLNERMRNFDVGYIDWAEATRINTEYGSTPVESDNLQNVFDCISQRTTNWDARPDLVLSDKYWYIFRTTHVTPKLLKDYTPISEQKGGAVLYYGAFQKDGDNILSFFPQDNDWTMPPRNTAVDIKTENRHFVLDSNNTPCPLFWVSATEEGKTPYVNWNSIGFFETENGGKFGASLCINAAAGQSQKASSVIVHSFGDYRYMNHSSATRSLRGNWWHNSISNTDHAYYPKFGSAEMFDGTPNNDNCLNSTAVSSRRWALNESEMLLKNDVSAEFFFTVINDKKYVGLAACEWDGDTISAIEICLLPDWFWGGVTYQVYEDLPDSEEIWYGPTVTPQPGVGTHIITQGGVGDAVLPQKTIFSDISNVAGGVHLYRVNVAAYIDAMNYMWQYASDEMLQIVMSSVMSVHQLPDELVPPKAAQCTSFSFGPFGIPLNPNSTAKGWAIDRYCRAELLSSFSANDAHKSLSRATGCYLDFEPYTSVSLYLPFAGSVQIPASQCIGGSIEVNALVDALNGDICYEVKTMSDSSILHDAAGNPLVNRYYATGNAAIEIPLFGITTGERQRLSSLGEKVGSGIQMAGGVAQMVSGNIVGGISSIASGAQGYNMAQYNQDHISRQIVNAGGVSGSLSAIGSKQIILSVTRPAEAYDDYWIALNGTTANVKTKISNIVSQNSDNVFAMDESNRIEFDDATVSEKAEIHRLMVGGVYL